MSMPTLTFVGTGAACGAPSFYCGCKACVEAKADQSKQRGCAGLLIQNQKSVLLDTPPELGRRLAELNVDTVAACVFTHSHFDHIGGLPALEYMVKLKTEKAVSLIGSAETLRDIANQQPFMLDVTAPHVLKGGETLRVDDVYYTALATQHSEGCFGYYVEFEQGGNFAYFPDSAPFSDELVMSLRGAAGDEAIHNSSEHGLLPPHQSAELKAARNDILDYLIIDCTFYGKNTMPDVHMNLDQAVEIAKRVGAKHTILTHLSMHYDTPITVEEFNAKLKSISKEDNLDISLAYDGQVIKF